jgi:hypothetical protein
MLGLNRSAKKAKRKLALTLGEVGRKEGETRGRGDW